MTALDPATLHDLDVLSTSTPRGRTLVSLVDRTRSRAGRDALRRRLVVLGESAEDIVALQRAHQSLAADAAGYRAVFDRTDSDSAERIPEFQLAVAFGQTSAHARCGQTVAA
jgi:hypothetical protein